MALPTAVYDNAMMHKTLRSYSVLGVSFGVSGLGVSDLTPSPLVNSLAVLPPRPAPPRRPPPRPPRPRSPPTWLRMGGLESSTEMVVSRMVWVSAGRVPTHS